MASPAPALRTAALVVALVSVAAACSEDDAVPGPPAHGAGSTASPEASDSERIEGSLSVAIGPPATLDPLRIADPGSVLIARQLFEGLTRWDPRTGTVRPAAARSWSVGEGGRVFEFRLRRGMRFHDGTRVTSRDFRYAFDRIALKDNAAEVAYTLERVRGFVAVHERGTARHLAGIETPGPLTLRISLRTPWQDFPAVLTHPSLVPLPRRAVEKRAAFRSRPIGNGSFAISRPWRGKGPVLLTAFEDAIRPPRVERLRFVSFLDASRSWLPFTRGRLDVAEVPADQVGPARRRYGSRGFRPLLAGLYFGLRLDAPGMGARRVRVAISRAIDRDRIGDAIYEGTLARPRGVVPQGLPGFRSRVCGRACATSPKAAARRVGGLSREARKVILDVDASALQQRVARAVRRDLERSGFDVDVRPRRLGVFLRRLARGRVEMFRFGWIAEYPSPDAFLTPLFSTRSPDNHTGFSSRKVDALLRRARATASDKVSTRLYRRAEKAIMRAVPVVPLGSFRMRWAVQPWV
ncbi:MAG TPA: ABC transporter substrate-binding protein, partial [Actinomycetota bacterium]|nr:ABC transporter substrate-binding protein [Actinomycetota bacterium]